MSPETNLRRAILPPIDRLKEALGGGYAVSKTTEDEYAATVYCDPDTLHSVMRDLGFSTGLVSALKVRPDEALEANNWVRRESLFADEQLHVVSHHDGETIDLYAHSEASKLAHPIRHYRTVGYSAEKGIEELRTLLRAYNEQGDGRIPYEVQYPYERLELVSQSLLYRATEPIKKRLATARAWFHSVRS